MSFMAGPKNDLEHSVRIQQDIVVPEPENRPSETVQVRGTLAIRVVAMLSAISLDHQPTFGTGEVRDEASNGLLAPKLESAELAIAKAVPESPLGIGRLAP